MIICFLTFKFYVSKLKYGVPVTLIAEAVFARCLSALKQERVMASKILPAPTKNANECIRDGKRFRDQVGRVFFSLWSYFNLNFHNLLRHYMHQRLLVTPKVLCFWLRQARNSNGIWIMALLQWCGAVDVNCWVPQ